MKRTIEQELENFRYNVIWLREHHQISETKMARIMRIGINSLRKIEQGEFPKNIGIRMFFCAGKYFGIPPAKLLSERLPFDEK